MATSGEEKGLSTVKSEGGKKLGSRSGNSGAGQGRRGKGAVATTDDYGSMVGAKSKLQTMTLNEFVKDFERLEKEALTMKSNGKTILDNFRNSRRHAAFSMQDPAIGYLSPKGTQYMPNEKIMRILQRSEDISRQFSA
jgi:hypothetical protein